MTDVTKTVEEVVEEVVDKAEEVTKETVDMAKDVKEVLVDDGKIKFSWRGFFKYAAIGAAGMAAGVVGKTLLDDRKVKRALARQEVAVEPQNTITEDAMDNTDSWATTEF